METIVKSSVDFLGKAKLKSYELIYDEREEPMARVVVEVPKGYKGEVKGAFKSFEAVVVDNYENGADGWMEGNISLNKKWELDLAVVSVTKL